MACWKRRKSCNVAIKNAWRYPKCNALSGNESASTSCVFIVCVRLAITSTTNYSCVESNHHLSELNHNGIMGQRNPSTRNKSVYDAATDSQAFAGTRWRNWAMDTGAIRRKSKCRRHGVARIAANWIYYWVTAWSCNCEMATLIKQTSCLSRIFHKRKYLLGAATG